MDKVVQKRRESIQDDDRTGKPTASITEENVVKIRGILNQDRRASLHVIAKRVEAIVTDRLGLSKLSTRWVPKALRTEHMTACLDNALNFLNKFDADPQDFLSRLVTGDETRIYQYDKSTIYQ